MSLLIMILIIWQISKKSIVKSTAQKTNIEKYYFLLLGPVVTSGKL